MEKDEVKEWECIWESDKYQSKIYDNCTIRVYRKKDKLKIERDGTKWIDNSSGTFHIHKYFVAGEVASELKKVIEEYDADGVSKDDVQKTLYGIMGIEYYM